MRARLHVHGYRIGFYREATHDLCDPATSRQLLDSTLDVIAGVSKALARREDRVGRQRST